MAEGGWIGIAIPEEYGGGGRGITEASIVLEEVAASGAAMNGAAAIHLSIFGMNPVVRHGSDEMKAALPAPRGHRRPARRLRRHRARRGTDTAAITTRAVRDGDSYIVTRPQGLDDQGAGLPRRVLLLIRTTPLEECAQAHRRADPAPARLQRTPRSTSARSRRWDATRSSRARSATTTCPSRSTDRVGEEGAGLPLPARRAEPRAHPGRLGGARHRPGRASVARSRYANERVVFGRPIGKNQGIAFPLAEAHARLQRPSWSSARRPGAIDDGLPVRRAGQHWPSSSPPRPASTPPTGHADPRRLRLRQRVRRRALLARGPAHADRPDHARRLVLNYLAEHVLGLPRSY